MPLPAPDISVDHANASSTTHVIVVTAKRDGKSRTWTGEGSTVNEAVKGVVEKIFADPRSGEFMK